MNQIVKELKDIPLSGNDIYNACEKNIKIMKYSGFAKCNNIDEAFENYNAISILYEVQKSYGHWVLLLRHPKIHTIEYMDSYGLFIDEPLKHIKEPFKTRSNQSFIYLSKLLNDSDYNIIYNKVKLQKLNKGVSSCGRHVCLRYIMRHIPLDKYVKIMKSDKNNNADDIATYLTAFI